MGDGDTASSSDATHPIGERLGDSGRLVVLGDPGSGKTTMLRWLATACLQRLQGDEAVADMPDVETLSAGPLLSVLIRCRDLTEEDLGRDFTGFLTQHLLKTELLPDDAKIMQAVVLDGIANGGVLLLVDGLDEITTPRVRSLFCQELERVAVRYPDAPIVVTSRIVGYRDMPYRMGAGFEHDVIADLTREDKDGFARKWVEVTESHLTAAERERQIDELIEALHSTDRIERLTGNPMLLTTLTLVKRKVGKLPNRRTDLYREAVGVLLNWNPLYTAIDAKEAMPQLEYVAYEMCRLGVQRLTKDDILDLLDGVRADYPNIRAVKERTSEQFLDLLEARSSILIESGAAWQDGDNEEPVWEFRHLTFQEYLASRALLEGRYRGHDRRVSLAEQVSELARPSAPSRRRDAETPESWREALRLVVADCKSDDVDDILLAILTPRDDEDSADTARGRAVLAGLCLADKPDASDKVGQRVLADFAAVVGPDDGGWTRLSSVEAAASEIGQSMWASRLRHVLVEEFCRQNPDDRGLPGSLWGRAEVARWNGSTDAAQEFCESAPALIRSENPNESIAAALVIMRAAFVGCAVLVDGLVDSLLDMLAAEDPPVVEAGAWALRWLSGGPWPGRPLDPRHRQLWTPSSADVRRIADVARRVGDGRDLTARALGSVLMTATDSESVPSIVPLLDSRHAPVRVSAGAVLGMLGDAEIVPRLLAMLGDEDRGVRDAAVEALARRGDLATVAGLLPKLVELDVSASAVAALGQLLTGRDRLELLRSLDDPSNRRAFVVGYARDRDEADRVLLCDDLRVRGPRVDPREPISSERVEQAVASRHLDLDASEVRARYEAMAPDLDLQLTWRTSD